MTPTEAAAEPGEAAREWRCFHCDEVFADIKCAREHFGDSECSTPVCKIASYEGRLVGYIRKLEREIDDYRAENDPISVSWHGREADHKQALIREEQRGYDKGLADTRADLARMKEALVIARSAITAAEPWVEAGSAGSWQDSVMSRIAAALTAIANALQEPQPTSVYADAVKGAQVAPDEIG